MIDFLVSEKKEQLKSIPQQPKQPKQALPQEASSDEIPWYQSIPADLLKGLIEGTSNLGRMISPQMDIPMQEPFSKKKLAEQLNQLIPSDPTLVGSALRRGAQSFPTASATGGGTLLQSALMSAASGALGEGLEEGGFSETTQAVGEILPFLVGGSPQGSLAKAGTPISKRAAQSKMLPERIRKIAQKRAANREEINELIQFAQKQGMTAEQIAPLVQGETKKRLLSRLAYKGGATPERLAESKSAISQVADQFKVGEFAKKAPTEANKNRLMQDLTKIYYDIPSKTRDLIEKDFNQLAMSPKDTESMVRFFRALNENYGANKAQLGRMKEPIRKALTSINPQLGKDFDLTNKLFQKYYDISSRLKPTLSSQFLEGSTIPKVMYGTFSGNYPLIKEAVGEATARKLSAELLTNPKFLNLSKKMVNALNKNKFVIADRIKEDYIRALNKDFPDVATELQKESFKQFIE